MAVYHNTLGVALYRAGKFQEALAPLSKSLEGSQGRADGFDLLVLAMCHHRLGNAAAARDHFDQAVRWLEQKGPQLPAAWRRDLAAFRGEAEELLGPR